MVVEEILKKPVITEKMTLLGDKLNKYGFIVEKAANKIQIKNAVEKMYGVTVVSVRTIVTTGKGRVRYTRTGFFKGKSSSLKKAIVTLAEGETIDFYSNI